MSRYGHLGRSGGDEPAPRSSRPPTAAQRWAVALQVISREAVVGAVLWSCHSPEYRVEVPAFALIFVVLVALTKRFGFSRPTTWRGAVLEATVVFFGSMCAANLVLLLYGPAPWLPR